MKSSRYMTRALKSSDRRFARVLGKLGYSTPGEKAAPPDPLAPLRTELEAAGVKVDGRWGEDRLRQELVRATRRPAARVEPKPVESRLRTMAGESSGQDPSRYSRRDLRAEDD